MLIKAEFIKEECSSSFQFTKSNSVLWQSILHQQKEQSLADGLSNLQG